MAVFCESTVNTDPAEQVARETGARYGGVLYVDSTAAVKEFTEGDRALFEALAGLVAVAHDQAERSRLAAELEVARSVQAALLPAEPVATTSLQNGPVAK